MGVMSWLGFWRTRRTFCYAFLAFQLTSSLGANVIDYFVGNATRRFAYYAGWLAVLTCVFLSTGQKGTIGRVSRATKSSPPDHHQRLAHSQTPACRRA